MYSFMVEFWKCHDLYMRKLFFNNNTYTFMTLVADGDKF